MGGKRHHNIKIWGTVDRPALQPVGKSLVGVHMAYSFIGRLRFCVLCTNEGRLCQNWWAGWGVTPFDLPLALG
jgi:hypothetical protein